ncbi:Probable methyltransferase PMT13, partial [Striga hermonthica]
DNHRSQAVYDDLEGYRHGAIKTRRFDNQFWKALAVQNYKVWEVIERTGFGPLFRMGRISTKNSLITCLVERWRPETNTFHFDFGEATITLQDIHVLFGLPVDGTPCWGQTINHEPHTWQEHCADYLGFEPSVQHRHTRQWRLLDSITVAFFTAVLLFFSWCSPRSATRLWPPGERRCCAWMRATAGGWWRWWTSAGWGRPMLALSDMVDRMPCEDPRINSQLSREMNFYEEGHCPRSEEAPLCLIPPPEGSTQSSVMFAAKDNNPEIDWYPDSGASHQVTNDFSNLSVASDYSGQNKLQIGNGAGLDISHVGKGSFLSQTNCHTKHHTFKLNNLLHVPEIAKNLISVAQFAKDNHVFFEFFPTFCTVKDQVSGQVLLKGILRDGLYTFKLNRVKSRSEEFQELSDKSRKSVIMRKHDVAVPVRQVYVARCSKSIELWHKRLGHPSFDVTRKALNDCNLPYVNNKIPFCSDCAIAKTHRLPFTQSSHVSHHPLQLIHTDLWGPAPIKSTSGSQYYVAFIDDYSKYTLIYFLKQKSDTLTAFAHFKNFVENQLNHKIKMVQSDGGTEFKPLSTLFNEAGIHHRISCPHTPQQNGLVERKHRQIVEVALSLFSQSNVPKRFWEECFSSAVYLINRIPNKTISFKTPFSHLFGHFPDYNHLRVFGCAAYPHLRPYVHDKLELRSQQGVFLGYSSQYKGYKVLLKNHKVIISRDVVFNENLLPYMISKQTEQSNLHTPQTSTHPPPHIVLDSPNSTSPNNTTTPIPTNDIQTSPPSTPSHTHTTRN